MRSDTRRLNSQYRWQASQNLLPPYNYCLGTFISSALPLAGRAYLMRGYVVFIFAIIIAVLCPSSFPSNHYFSNIACDIFSKLYTLMEDIIFVNFKFPNFEGLLLFLQTFLRASEDKVAA